MADSRFPISSSVKSVFCVCDVCHTLTPLSYLWHIRRHCNQVTSVAEILPESSTVILNFLVLLAVEDEITTPSLEILHNCSALKDPSENL